MRRKLRVRHHSPVRIAAGSRNRIRVNPGLKPSRKKVRALRRISPLSRNGMLTKWKRRSALSIQAG